eukprot:728261-Karenia_brevis.AAC.1
MSRCRVLLPITSKAAGSQAKTERQLLPPHNSTAYLPVPKCQPKREAVLRPAPPVARAQLRRKAAVLTKNLEEEKSESQDVESSDFTSSSGGHRVRRKVVLTGRRRTREHYEEHVHFLASGTSFLENSSVSEP